MFEYLIRPSGRMSRRGFWAYFLIPLAPIVLSIHYLEIKLFDMTNGMVGPLWFILFFLLIWPISNIYAMRLMDCDVDPAPLLRTLRLFLLSFMLTLFSGWISYLLFQMSVGMLFLFVAPLATLTFYFIFFRRDLMDQIEIAQSEKGTPGPNKFGPKPWI